MCDCRQGCVTWRVLWLRASGMGQKCFTLLWAGCSASRKRKKKKKGKDRHRSPFCMLFLSSFTFQGLQVLAGGGTLDGALLCWRGGGVSEIQCSVTALWFGEERVGAILEWGLSLS